MAPVTAEVTASAYVKAGRLVIRNRSDFDDQVRHFREGVELEISVTRLRATRSLHQNAWYWGVVIEALSDVTGYDPDDVHEFLKMRFIPKRLAICNSNGEIVDEYVLGGSTRKMTTQEFSDYCQTIQRWAAETLDCYIPDPNEGA